MPAVWPGFITSVGGWLDDKSEKTHMDTAEKIASEYHKAVSTAQTSLHATMVMVQPPYIPIKMSIKKCLDDIRDSEGKPQLFHFTDWSAKTVSYWMSVQYQLVPFHPIAIATSTGTAGVPVPVTNVTTVGGTPPTLANDLLKAFTHPPAPALFGIPFATKLATAFTNHLTTVQGLHTHVVTAGTPATPVPLGPIPYPWSGLV
jgi:hypothetical protein